MSDTHLSRRQIQATLLALVAFMGVTFCYTFIESPTTSDPVGSRRFAVISGLIGGLAIAWFVKLMIDAVRDWRSGVKRGPAKVTGRFNIIFGAVVAIGGITCSAITYWSAAEAGGGIWTLYYGMILWGLVQAFIGYLKLQDSQEAASPGSPDAG